MNDEVQSGPVDPLELGQVPPNPDPWADRHERMRCKTCMWYVPKQARVDFGRCRRHAPSMSGFPAVYARDWCGDHKLNERHA